MKKQWPRTLVRTVTMLLAAVALCIVAFLIALRPYSALADAEQYSVFSDYLDPWFTGESHSAGDRRNLVLIDGITNSGLKTDLFFFAESLCGTRTALRARSVVPFINFLVTNVSPRQLKRFFAFRASYKLLTVADLELYPTEAFQKKYPTNYGYHTFSRVGFNREMTEAVFYTEHVCGLCGEGKYVYMRKIDGKWSLVSTVFKWVS